MKLLLQVCVFAGCCLLAGLTVAQPLEGIVARDVKTEFERICAPELAAMLASWNSLGQNGPYVDQYYLNVSRLDADGVQALIRQYRGQTPGLLPRRSDTPQYRATNIWENCLLNVRLAQVGTDPTEITQEPEINEEPEADEVPADTGEPAPELEPDGTLMTDEDGNSQFIMADGSNCISTQPSQRLSTQQGYYDQLLSIRNKCNFPIVLNVCNLDGTCEPVTVAATSTVLHVLGTTYGVTQNDPPPQPQAPPAPPATSGGSIADNSPIDFGDDSSRWANDGECDDPRFSGAGAAAELVEADLYGDASDCRAALNAGTIAFVGYVDRSVDDTSGIDFGDDSSSWANDGECDDPRFSGAGSAAELVEADLYRDASDCRVALAAGTIAFTGYTSSGASSYSDDVTVEDDTDDYGIGDAIGDVLGAYGDYLCAQEGGCDDSGGDYDSGDYDSGDYDSGDYDDSGDYGSDEDDCPYNSDADPTTVCTVQ